MSHLSADRRTFLAATGSAFAALAASGCTTTMAAGGGRGGAGYGPLRSDPAGLIDLPEGFSYRTISNLGEMMNDGFTVPDAADGMGCFDLGNGKLALVRNHELVPGKDGGGVAGPAFDTVARSLVPLPGGTTTLVLDAETLAVERQYRSLAGTIRNCGGGITPWGSWLTCEEAPVRADGRINQDHGWTFEVPADAPGLVDPVPLKAMGRFNHEAACVDPATGIVYQTEDRDDSLLYRFIPKVPGKLAEGGRLQALVISDAPADTRNWAGAPWPTGSWADARWIDLDDVESPEDDLRQRGAADGAALFARGEGIHMGDGEFYFCCTSGGAAKLGQVFRLVPGTGGAPDRLQLFFESTSPDQFNYGDNLTVGPNGHLVVCEDQYTEVVSNHLRGITPAGEAYPLALLRQQTEWAGACFSPDGRTLFVNAYSPTRTFAITGPWLA
ncbi:alkaline phosphatase PhoX [Pelagerythrobacter marensis]|uniref:Phosphatase n=1 Tax=Pelagerythrobacter marensis TaxID=543877 RepID=A0A0G3X6J0_9SPHN|nr:alkaline phosphatase PhoX [Pelagerythrobacter marensis]AKM06236.1 Phosphatase [Pelagerythrobacter marensis]